MTRRIAIVAVLIVQDDDAPPSAELVETTGEPLSEPKPVLAKTSGVRVERQRIAGAR